MIFHGVENGKVKMSEMSYDEILLKHEIIPLKAWKKIIIKCGDCDK